MKTIYLHGFSGNKKGLGPFAEAMNIAGGMCVDMPGFGDNDNAEFQLNWPSYIEATLATIDTAGAQGEKLHIIGHSHGAMVAYGIAALYPERVEQLTLLCPVARGTIVARGFLWFSRACYSLVGRDRFVLFMRNRLVVDTITFLGRQRSWPKGTYVRVRATRRQEARAYSERMSQLLDMVPSYTRVFSDTKAQVLTIIVRAQGDALANKKDAEWFSARTGAERVQSIQGGHLAPVVFPRKLASIISR